MIIKSSLQIREFYNLFLEIVHIYLIVYVHIYLIVYRPGFAARLKSLDITQSMSRVSCCIDNGCEESFQGILKDMMSILYPDTDSLESAQEAVRKTIEYYMNEYPQERFGGRTAAEVRAEAFKTEIPPEYPIKPNLRIEKFWDRIAQKRVNRQQFVG
ncbi:hypothetical protein [Dubosiella newyorkensis]|uniref:hypothetical protein n=1 Tax=Dubosiella newyorkensis TaxID=1862672 RepID=UPI00272DB55A|nr:hypothetical protein [Dubosiella newyorkensis]